MSTSSHESQLFTEQYTDGKIIKASVLKHRSTKLTKYKTTYQKCQKISVHLELFFIVFMVLCSQLRLHFEIKFLWLYKEHLQEKQDFLQLLCTSLFFFFLFSQYVFTALLSVPGFLPPDLALLSSLKQVQLSVCIGQCLVNVSYSATKQQDKDCRIIITTCGAVVPTCDGAALQTLGDIVCPREHAACSVMLPICLVTGIQEVTAGLLQQPPH